MIRLSIKGTEVDARTALASHGLVATFVDATPYDTFWDVPEASRLAVVKWFCEGGYDLPLHVGSLTWHN